MAVAVNVSVIVCQDLFIFLNGVAEVNIILVIILEVVVPVDDLPQQEVRI